MAGTSISVDIEDAEVQKLLGKMSGFKLLELARIAGPELEKISNEAFQREKDPVTGTPWLKIQAIKRDNKGRFVKGSKTKTLYDTGDLFRSIAYDAGSRGSLLEIGSNMAYARIHQEGGQAGRGKKVAIPQRRYLGEPPGFGKALFNMPQTKKLLGV